MILHIRGPQAGVLLLYDPERVAGDEGEKSMDSRGRRLYSVSLSYSSHAWDGARGGNQWVAAHVRNRSREWLALSVAMR